MSPDPCCPFQTQRLGTSSALPLAVQLRISGWPTVLSDLLPGPQALRPLGVGALQGFACSSLSTPGGALCMSPAAGPFHLFTQQSCGGTDAAGTPFQVTEGSWDSYLPMVTPTGARRSQGPCAQPLMPRAKLSSGTSTWLVLWTQQAPWLQDMCHHEP